MSKNVKNVAKAVEDAQNAVVVKADTNTALTFRGRALNLSKGISAEAKEKTIEALSIMDTTLTVLASAQLAVCEALYNFYVTGYWKNVYKAPNELYKDFKDFSKDFFGLERSATNDALKIQKKYFEIYDEDGNKVPFMIGEHEAKDYSKTALVQLSVLDEDELKSAIDEGLKPELTSRETSEVIRKVHAPKGKNGKTANKAHPCETMDLAQYTDYVRSAHNAFIKSDAFKALKLNGEAGKAIKSKLDDYLNEWTKAVKEVLSMNTHKKSNEPSEAVKEALQK